MWSNGIDISITPSPLLVSRAASAAQCARSKVGIAGEE
jgi:hypothetical protein